MSTVAKALGVLTLFSEDRPMIGLSEAARLLKRDKSTMQRHLADLCAAGFLEQDAPSRAYYLGPALTRLAMVREQTHPAERELRAILEELVEATGETAHASRLAKGELICVAIEETRFKGTRVYIDPADPLPLHASGSGVAVLASSDDGFVEQVIARGLPRFTQETPTEAQAIRDRVARARRVGWSLAQGTFEADVVGQAAPILGYGGKPVGAVAVATPTSRFNEEVEARNGPLIAAAAARISVLFGAETPAAAE